jgi:hypothetical protein
MHTKTKNISIRTGSKESNFFLSTLFCVLILSGCVGIPITYYDATTYTQLTSLKAETTLLIDSFDTKKVAENRDNIEKTTLNLRKAYEYELGKGKPNSDTSKQFKIIIGLFNDDVKDYQEDGPNALGKKYFREASVALGQAFDIAIATENLKNKDKQ